MWSTSIARVSPATLRSACTLACLVLLAACAGSSPVPPALASAPTASVPSEAAASSSPSASPSRAPGYARAAEQFDDFGMRLECLGTEAPTVVLEYGIGGGVFPGWLAIRGPISRFTRVCTYERTDLRGRPPSPVEIARALRGVLADAGAMPPYVLVGHSWGGIYMRVFAHEYGADVAGMVLVDPSHPEQTSRFLDALGPAAAGESKAVARTREDFEGFAADPVTVESTEQVRPATSIGDRPLIVLTAARSGIPGLPPDVTAALHEEWLSMNAELAELSSNSIHVIATKSGHNIPIDQGDLTVAAIRDVVEAVRSGMPLPPCGADLEALDGECVASE